MSPRDAEIPAPDPAFTDPKGRPVTLQRVLADGGDRLVLLAFFKVNCPVCQMTWPYLQKLHTIYGKDGVRVVGVSQNDPTSTAAYNATYGPATFDFLYDTEPSFPASNAFAVEAVPHLALIDSRGKIRKTYSGWQRREMEDVGRTIAASRGLDETPVIADDDPVVAWKAG